MHRETILITTLQMIGKEKTEAYISKEPQKMLFGRGWRWLCQQRKGLFATEV